MTKGRQVAGVLAGTLSLALGVWWQAPAQERVERREQVIRNGRLVGMELPADWKLAERTKNLTYTNPFGQNLAARWVDGEIVYRVSFGEVVVDPAKTKVAKEYLAVYSAPGPGDPPTQAERVPDQLAIYDSKPGDPEYSPIWHYHYVVVPRDYKPNTLRSEEDVKRSGYRVAPVNHFTN
jgi:hypothetical protein